MRVSFPVIVAFGRAPMRSRAGKPDGQLAHVDLVHGPLEDEVLHLGDRRQIRPGLVGRQRDDRIAGIREALEQRSRRRRADDRLHAGAAALDAALLEQLQVVLGLGERDPGLLEGLHA